MTNRNVFRICVLTGLLAAVVVTLGNACSGGFTAQKFSADGFEHLPSVGGSPVIGMPDNSAAAIDAAARSYAPIKQPELKPLTPREYDRSLQVMLGLNEPLGKNNLPAMTVEPFDNNADANVFSKVNIDGFEYTATKVADAFLASPTRATYITCTPTGATDRACLEKFALRLATLAYRRTVTAAEIKDIVDLALASSTRQANFNGGIRLVIQVILQDPRFVYRFEPGVPKGAEFELTAEEYLSKVTFFLLGAPPTLQQIEEVKAGALATPAAKEAFIQKLLDDPNVVNQVDLFHGFWMGYAMLGGQSTSADNFRTETKALIAKVLQERLPWSTVLSSQETYANETLAKVYDLDDQTTTGWKWRKYKDTLRQGLLSQGSYLSVGIKFGDTSTTRRGYNAQKALFCAAIGKPPTVDENGKPVDTDVKPPSDVVYECKEDLYRNTVLARRNCAQCHALMDNAGFGLENFGGDAGYRTTEPGKTMCAIRGKGEIYVQTPNGNTPIGTFSGPKELADLALKSGYAERCMAQRLVEFSFGRKLNGLDAALIAKVNALNKKAPDFKSFLKSYLLSAEFSTRRGI